jgi:Protein of unknown function (DUF998)
MKKNTKLLALVSLSGNVLFILAVFILHFLIKDLYPPEHFVSEYAIGHYSWVQTLAFYAVAIAQVCLIIGIMADIKLSILSIASFSIWTISMILIAIFPTNLPDAIPNTENIIHNQAAVSAFVSLIVAMFAWGFDFKKNEDWKSLTKLSWFFGGLGFIILYALAISSLSIRGFSQRIFLAWILTWLIIVSRQLYLTKNK